MVSNVSGPGGLRGQTLPGTKIQKVQLIRTNPEAAAAISKAARSALRTSFDISNPKTYQGLRHNQFQAISDVQKDRLSQNQNILDVFPDILLGEQIIVSSILSPKDLISENLIYGHKGELIPPSLQQRIDELIRSHMDEFYNFEKDLSVVLKEALFRTGSYVVATIPEAAVDELINGTAISTESLRDLVDSNNQPVSMGILGSPTTGAVSALESLMSRDASFATTTPVVNLESFKETMFKHEITKDNPGYKKALEGMASIEITDNYQLLKLPAVSNAMAERRVKAALKNPMRGSKRYSLESIDGRIEMKPKKSKTLSAGEFEKLIYKNIDPMSVPFQQIPTRKNLKRRSIGRPLRTRIPSEAVIPVFPPGDPGNHRGYFVLVDGDGNWVTKGITQHGQGGLDSLVRNHQQNNTLEGMLLEKTKRSFSDQTSTVYVDNMLEIYSSIVEKEMVNRLRNGVYGTELQFSKDREWDRVMLARALQGKMTRMVYIPKEIVTYYAFMFHDNGIGMSYLDQIRILSSIRAALLFSKTMGQLKNSINVTKMEIQLDPDDHDPMKTIEVATADAMQLRENYFPLGVNAPVDLMQWIQRAGFMVTYSGHPGLPDTKFDFSNGSMQHQLPDIDLDENLRKYIFMAFGLTPEQVDEGFSANFATTVLHQNALFAKRIKILSDQFSELLSADCQNVVSNDATIREEILDVLKEAGDQILKYADEREKTIYANDREKFLDYMVDSIIANIYVDLPKPDLGSVTDKMEAFNEMDEAYEKALESWISSEVLNADLNGELAQHADDIKKVYKHFLLRGWMSDEGFLPEISELFARDENEKPIHDVLDIIKTHVNDTMLSAMEYIKEVSATRNAADKDLDNLNVEGGGSSYSGDEGSEGGGGDEFGGDFGFGGGGDEFGSEGETSGEEDTGTEGEEGSPEEGEGEGTEGETPEGEESSGTGEEEKTPE